MITLTVDGAFKPDTKEGGLGIEITSSKERHLKKYYISHVFDNHQLEFLALYYGLKELVKFYPKVQRLHIQSDSQIVVDSVEKAYVGNELYKEYLKQILNVLEPLTLYFITWVPERENRFVDQLAKQALMQAGQYEKISLNE